MIRRPLVPGLTPATRPLAYMLQLATPQLDTGGLNLQFPCQCTAIVREALRSTAMLGRYIAIEGKP